MINRIQIDKKTIAASPDFHYCAGVDTLPEEIVFEPGVNVLCGNNGSGKSSILNMLKLFTFTEKSFYSEWPREYPWIYLDRLSNKDGTFPIQIYADYRYTFFSFRDLQPLQHKMHGGDTLGSLDNLRQYFIDSRISRGQSVLETFNILFECMFGKKKLKGDELKFPLEKLINYTTKEKPEYSHVAEYYQRHLEADDSYRYTLLMDEPDNNLDINNIRNTLDIYAKERPDTQIIVSLHNPIALYKLAKQKNPPNFIELTQGYIADIVNFVEESKRE